MSAAYTFLPWVQSGIGRSVAALDEPGVALTARVRLPVSVHVDGAGDVPATVQLYGPGDVTGLDPGQIVRCDPPAGTTRFEAGSMPQIQFARADLPWLFTPAAPGTAKTRLRPWLVLIAVRRGEGVRLGSGVLELDDPAAELPDLSQSWAWAHGQITGLPTGARPAELLASDPGRGCSRLVCPRHLEPDTAYVACVVPAFRAGVKAGLGDPVTPADEAALEPAWGPTPAGPLRLPVYHAWEFATGPAGSFETLVRRLHPSPFDAAPPRLDLNSPGGGLPAAGVIGMQSALRAPGDDAPPPWPNAAPFQAALAQALNQPDVVAPPLYGQMQAGGTGLPAAGWLRDLNLDPRLRVAAAAGTRVVQERQEQLMARAWEQAGAANDVNALLRRSQLARELGNVVLERHLAPLAADELLAMTQPAHATIALAGTTVDGEVRASRVPEAVMSGAMRRLASPQGVLARRAGPTPRIDLLTAVDREAMKPAPGAPNGMVVTTSLAARVADVDTRPALSAAALRVELLARLAPEATVLARAKARIDAAPTTWTRPDPLAQVAAGPRFDEAMYDGLQEVAPWLFLPGIEQLEADGVALLETSPRVIEAYLAGLNHELSRELLWREYPSVLNGTAFRQFWDAPGTPDVPPMSEWDSAPLGGHLRGGDKQLVLAIRGELLRRYPTTTIYAARALAGGALDPATRLAPMFRAAPAPDVVLVGFALGEEDALGGLGWYFVFEEYPGEPRFGFDEVASSTAVPTTPDALAWSHIPVTASGHADVTKPITASANLQGGWGKNAAGTAMLTFQQPFRVALHASRLVKRRTA
ncbi:hypothetical protein [Solirubrobacter soli]|uniref:hypothetical protein n=1 Tax=Solirubrobacter soli TaxID=363832 RepID=UPI00042081DF|nr:hypothetical protein [Solirubrobacter soli]